jgi:hypothetical protein
MNIQDILTILSISVIVLGGLRWYIGTQVKPIEEAINDVRSETKTNGGSSMRDEIKAIKREQELAAEIRKEQKDKLDHMYDLLLEYISKKN